MAVPITSALFAKSGILQINNDNPQICQERVCCLHGNACPGPNAANEDTANGPGELLERVSSYLNSKSIKEEEMPVYNTIHLLLTTLETENEKNGTDGSANSPL